MHKPAKTLRLLCIDDDAAFVELLSRQLISRDITVFHAFDAIQGYRLAVTERPDLIITDYCMPYRFGTHLLRQLREDPQLSQIPVTVVTGRDVHGQLSRLDDPVQSRLLKDLGAENVLRKPLNWKLLFETIDDYVTASRSAAEPRLPSTAMTCDDVRPSPEASIDGTAMMKTVLVVEDDTQARQALKKRLQTSGFHVLTASNGDAGVKLAARYRPDAITLDIRLPDMDGFEVAQRLHNDERTDGIPIIFVAGKVDRHFCEMSRSAGGRYFLRKPFDVELLINAVNDVTADARDPFSQGTIDT